jgi:hypothetical protein
LASDLTEHGVGTVDRSGLKLLINVALKQFDAAQRGGNFPHSTTWQHRRERKLFYQTLNVVLEVQLDEETSRCNYLIVNFRQFGSYAWMQCVGVSGRQRASSADANQHEAGDAGPAPTPD